MSLPLVIQLCYAVFCVGLAGVNYWIIEVKQWPVKHFWNGLIHVSYWFGSFIMLCKSAETQYGSDLQRYAPVLALPFIARVCFDWALNGFRPQKGLGYVPIHPKAISDKIEKAIFGTRGILPKLIWIVVVILINIFR